MKNIYVLNILKINNHLPFKISHLSIYVNLLIIYIYINSFPCALLNRHRKRHDRNEKNPFFRIRKSGLSPPELHGLTHQSPLFRTQKSLVSRLTQILYDRPHLQGESTSSFLSPTHLDNRFPADAGIKSRP